MAPAYTLAVLIFLVWLLRNTLPSHRLVEHMENNRLAVGPAGVLMFHVNVSDIPYWSPLFSWLGVAGPIDGQRAYSIVNAYSLAFFDRHLKGQLEALLKGPRGRYPEVLFEGRQP